MTLGIPGARPGRRLHAARAGAHDAPRHRAGRGGLRGAHRLWQVADRPLARRSTARDAGGGSRSSATRCPTATSSGSGCSASPRRADLDAAGLHHRGARGVRAAPGRRQRRVRRRGLRRDPRAGAGAEPTCWSGTAATTTSRSSAPICTSWSWTRCVPMTPPATIPARPCCAWRTSSSSARSTRLRAAQVARAVATVARVNPRAPDRARRALAVRLDTPELVRGRRVLVVEDGPTITHGSMPYGAGFVAATAAGAAAIVDPAASARSPSWPRSSRGIPTSAPCCRPSATAPPRCRRCAPPSSAATPMSWWRRPRWISPAAHGQQPDRARRYEFQDGGADPARDSWIDGSLGSRRPSGARPPHRPAQPPANS